MGLYSSYYFYKGTFTSVKLKVGLQGSLMLSLSLLLTHTNYVKLTLVHSCSRFFNIGRPTVLYMFAYCILCSSYIKTMYFFQN